MAFGLPATPFENEPPFCDSNTGTRRKRFEKAAIRQTQPG
jgi:hypothetical protein